ncbi:ABC transporter substrate-binding protein [Mycolicibacterium parafortuitum]|uniref:ABC transporter substrate-binding protein n=1 Tax=Mycolicibacterium parafortuitum TaxID=39692 RepID=A0A7I7UAN9_MYCPF|nr:ABC transporter permease [Mycolicibacterium parafortuitum]BBY78081.1 ABC transporter substrate-binding protein [Mycolicibacterium parafortuitum]
METSRAGNVPTAIRSAQIPVGSGNTFTCLIRFALANIRRRPERFVLAVLGIALAIACVTVVRTISASFATTGEESVADVLGDAALWVVPAAGVRYDPAAQALVADGPAPAITAPDGWNTTRVASGVIDLDGEAVALRGSDEIPSGRAELGRALADRLSVQDGDVLAVGDQHLTAAITGEGQSMTVPAAQARSLVGDNGWWVVHAPPGLEQRRDLGSMFGAAVGLPSAPDPAVRPDPAGEGLIYDTVGGSGPLTFAQKYSALFSGKVTGSTLGLISTIGLGLGFVIAVSSFLAAVTERRREFGIMSSIGLADEVLYFFLVESAVVFLAAYLIGVVAAGVAVALVIPSIASLGAWLQGAALTAMFLPAMAIVGALVPVHRLLQQRPVALLECR